MVYECPLKEILTVSTNFPMNAKSKIANITLNGIQLWIQLIFWFLQMELMLLTWDWLQIQGYFVLKSRLKWTKKGPKMDRKRNKNGPPKWTKIGPKNRTENGPKPERKWNEN